MSIFTSIFKRSPRLSTASSWEPIPSEVPYMLPKDEHEINRLDMQHYILQKAYHAHFLAPLQHPETILDVGSGTGRWVKDMGEAFPRAQVYGFDLDRPAIPSFPANCSFAQGNLLHGLPYQNNCFDFVHQRLLILGLPLHYWPQAIQELIRVARPGGWIELVECDLRFFPQGPYTTDVIRWLDKTSQQRGIDIRIATKLNAFLAHAGLMNVTEKQVAIPLGNWGGHLGRLLLSDVSWAVKQTIKPLIVENLKLDPAIYDFTVDQWLKECERLKESCHFNLVYAQKGERSYV